MGWRQEHELESCYNDSRRELESSWAQTWVVATGMMRSGGAKGYLRGKLTAPLGEGPIGGTSGKDETCWWWEGNEFTTEHLKEALRRRSEQVAKAGVNYTSLSQHFSVIRSFISPNIGFLSSARKDPGQSGTQNSQNLLSGLIRQWGTPTRK